MGGRRELLEKSAARGNRFSFNELIEVVATNDKKRFSLAESCNHIRANQGHSIDVDVELKKKKPPENLYHGTATKNPASIRETGLRKMSRNHVHLSANIETARNVGSRYGMPVILSVDTRGMKGAGFEFFISENGVWLVEAVPPQFLNELKIVRFIPKGCCNI